MPLDYSKFDRIGDSDSDGGHGPVDLSDFFPGAAEGDGGGDDDDSPPESPREALARAAAAKAGPGQASAGGGAGASAATAGAGSDAAATPSEPVPPATLERFVELAEGAPVTRGEDTIELITVARATAQSALAAGEPSTLRRLVQALVAGLSAQPKAVPFAREQAPELVAELLAVAAGPAQVEDCERLLELLVAKCRTQEVYTFLLESLCGDELDAPTRIRGVDFLQQVLLKMEESKRHMFLGSCFPTLLKKSITATTPSELLPRFLQTLRSFAMTFLPKVTSASVADPAVVVQSMITAFLFKVLQRSLPLAFPAEALELRAPAAAAVAEAGGASSGGGEPRPKKVCGAGGLSMNNSAICLRGTDASPSVVEALCALARDAASSSSKSLLSLLEEVETGDPTSDGGGDLEVSPLCLSGYVCLLETPGCWHKMKPQVLPIVLSPVRRLNVLMRSCYIMVCNKDDAPDYINLGDPSPSSGSGSTSSRGSRWAHRGLELFARCAGPMLHVAADQSPKAFMSLSGTLCRWYPQRTFQALLEALASTGDIERDARAALFRAIKEAMQRFDWPCQSELYRDIVKKCRVDSIIGAVVTLFKDGWWTRVQALSADDRKALAEERARLIDILKATLSGDVQVVDGMDTLTAALNIARLVALTSSPAGAFLRAGLRRGGPGVDLDGLLAGVSQQIDFELKVLDEPPTGGLGAELAAKAIGEALGKGEGAVDFEAMKRDRITMVAHLVARVREVLAAAEA